MELQTAFYIIGIIYMGLMLVLFIALVTAVLVIKAKINHIHRMIDEKVQVVSGLADAAKSVFKKKTR